MNNIVKILIALAVLAGTANALNPPEINIGTCPDEGFADGLLFGPYTYDAGYRVAENLVTAGGLEFWLSDFGMIQYLGDPLKYYAERGFGYQIVGPDGAVSNHYATVHLDPCTPVESEISVEILSPVDGSEITVGQTVSIRTAISNPTGLSIVGRQLINGVLYRSSSWTPTSPGEYDIRSEATLKTDTDWSDAASDEVSITVS